VAHTKPVEKIGINECLHPPRMTIPGPKLCRIVYCTWSCRSAAARHIRHSPGFGIAPQVMGCKGLYPDILRARLYYVPNYILGDAGAPHGAVHAD
jgi:hypothetical protein